MKGCLEDSIDWKEEVFGDDQIDIGRHFRSHYGFIELHDFYVYQFRTEFAHFGYSLYQLMLIHEDIKWISMLLNDFVQNLKNQVGRVLKVLVFLVKINV